MSAPSRRLPAALAERARAYTAAPVTPVPARPAATVVLLRDGKAGVEAYLLRRRLTMAFAAGMYAFPGGKVDPRDAHASPAWAGPPPEEWGRRLGVDAETARAAVCAAVRETFEEAAVLLAGAGPASVVGDTGGPDWESDRQALLAGALPLGELLSRRGLVLRSDLLGAWSRWITPRFESRRYDTWFFVAALPEAQQARDVSGEADAVVWLRPADAVAAAGTGDAAMLPPTWVTLEEIAAYRSVAEVLAAAAARTAEAPIPAWTPGWVIRDDEVSTLLPSDEGYPGDDPGVPGDDPGGAA